jgi:hypothetical protein
MHRIPRLQARTDRHGEFLGADGVVPDCGDEPHHPRPPKSGQVLGRAQHWHPSHGLTLHLDRVIYEPCDLSSALPREQVSYYTTMPTGSDDDYSGFRTHSLLLQ